jgi:hypothetical protein
MTVGDVAPRESWRYAPQMLNDHHVQSFHSATLHIGFEESTEAEKNSDITAALTA